MYTEVLQQVAEAAARKAVMARRRLAAYLAHSALAGIYVGFGIVLIFTIGGPVAAAGSPAVGALMGAAFGVALSLVIFAGADLFTGNNMIMPVGLLARRAGWGDLGRVWWWSYVGNLLGSLFLAWLVVRGGTVQAEPVAALITKVAAKKMSLGFWEAFFRGVLCNWLVSLAVWISFRARSEPARLIMIFWALFAFIGAGYEHSVANMTLLAMANLLPHGPEVSWLGMARNLVPVTLGNVVSGALFVGVAYWYMSPWRAARGEAAEAGAAALPGSATVPVAAGAAAAVSPGAAVASGVPATPGTAA